MKGRNWAKNGLSEVSAIWLDTELKSHTPYQTPRHAISGNVQKWPDTFLIEKQYLILELPKILRSDIKVSMIYSMGFDYLGLPLVKNWKLLSEHPRSQDRLERVETC